MIFSTVREKYMIKNWITFLAQHCTFFDLEKLGKNYFCSPKNFTEPFSLLNSQQRKPRLLFLRASPLPYFSSRLVHKLKNCAINPGLNTLFSGPTKQRKNKNPARFGSHFFQLANKSLTHWLLGTEMSEFTGSLFSFFSCA